MTNKEAASLLGWLKSKTNREDDLEAIDMAIDALSADGDLISREDAINAVHKYFVDAFNNEPHEIDEDGDDVFTYMKSVNALLHHNKMVSKAIKSLPSADAEPSLKAIKRQIDEHWYLDAPSAETHEIRTETHGRVLDGRADTIKELGEWLEQMIQHGVPSHSAKRKALATAIALLSAEAVQGWIPCSERLPDWKDMVEGVIITTENGRVTFADYCTENGTFHDVGQDVWASDIIAWQPLPKPYKGGNDTTGESL